MHTKSLKTTSTWAVQNGHLSVNIIKLQTQHMRFRDTSTVTAKPFPTSKLQNLSFMLVSSDLLKMVQLKILHSPTLRLIPNMQAQLCM